VGAVLQVSCDVNGACAAIANPATMTPASINQFNGGSLILTNRLRRFPTTSRIMVAPESGLR
jgi:uncharacterized protein (DUF2062 family)